MYELPKVEKIPPQTKPQATGDRLSPFACIHTTHTDSNCLKKKGVHMSKQEYIKKINRLMKETNDITLLDLILRILKKSI